MTTAVVVGNVIGSGVFKKPSAVADAVPSFGWAMAAWILLGVLTMCGGLAPHSIATSCWKLSPPEKFENGASALPSPMRGGLPPSFNTYS